MQNRVVSALIAILAVAFAMRNAVGVSRAQPEQRDVASWAVTQAGNELQIAYGSGATFPQYGVLHLDSSYFRLNYGPASGWGTSVILLPAFWSGGQYHQGAPVTATWQVAGPNLVLSSTGSIATLNVSRQLTLFPPTDASIMAHVMTSVQGSVPLDNRPGEAFKPAMLSSVHISSTLWDSQAACANCQNFALPAGGWVISNMPVVTASNVGLLGGTSAWKTNAPTVWLTLEQPMQVAGWVTPSVNPNDDNVGLWAASNSVLSAWSYEIAATAGTSIRCLYLPLAPKS